MKLKVEGCYYELVKDLLLSQDSLIQFVEKTNDGILVSLKENKTKEDFMILLEKEPLFVFTQFSKVHVV